MRLARARILASTAALVTVAGALAAAVIPSASAGIDVPVVLAGSAATPLPAHAVRVGVLPEASRLTVDVELKLGNEAGLDALVSGLADPSSPFFHDFVGKGEFGPEFGLSLTAIAQVSGTLRSLGLDPGAVDADRLYIPVSGSASAIDRAFGLTLVDYRLADGRVAFANSAAPKVPASIAPYVGGVLGLDNVYQAGPLDHLLSLPAGKAAGLGGTSQPAASGPAAGSATAAVPGLAAPQVPRAAAPQACTSAVTTAAGFGGYTSTQLAAHYAMSSLYSLGDLGQGVRVAVAELQPNLPSDIAGYESCYGIHTPVNYITVDTSVGTGPGTSEAALDIEDIASIAPDVTIDDYEDGSTTVDPLYDIAAKVADQDKDQVLSISYGLCEAEAGPSTLTAYQTVFKTLNAEGITTVAAAGDYGPTGCYTGKKASPALSPFTPASTAYVLSVGGTAMSSAVPLSTETAWNGTGSANPGAGGGGISSKLCMPGYQDYNQESPSDPPILGVISSDSVKAASCDSKTDPDGYRRELPDVSADASGSSPYVIYFNGKWNGVYGTSAATALIAAEAALIDGSPYCSSKGWDSGNKVGLLPQGLYKMVSTNNTFIYMNTHPYVLQDITAGNTDDTASGYTGGLYAATNGYDEATGLGTPLLTATNLPEFEPGMASNMCHWYATKGLGQVSNTGISPSIARAGRATTATLNGTGYIEVPDSVVAEIDNKTNTKYITAAFASCSSHTSCKVTIPALKAGTYQIESLVMDILPCTDGCQISATFKVYAAPTITKLLPSKGGKGTKLTIRGTNFVGVKGVYFGSKKGVGTKVISSTQLIVTVPAGSGTVALAVAAVGGTSKAVPFRY